jgi:hypothetical protein
LRAAADDVQAIVFAEGPSGPIQQNVPAPYRNVLAAGTINHQRGDNTTMSVTFSYQDQSKVPQDVGGVTLPSAGSNWSFSQWSVTYSQQTIIKPTLEPDSALLRRGVGADDEHQSSASSSS